MDNEIISFQTEINNNIVILFVFLNAIYCSHKIIHNIYYIVI